MPASFDSNVTFRLDFAFGVNPYTTVASSQWTDVSEYVKGIATDRGRTHELDDIQAGFGEFRLDNRDRRFDPSNTGSTYAPNVQPMTPCRFQAIHSGTTYDVFRGFVESWPQTWAEGGYAQETTVTAVDGFRLFSFTETATTHPQEGSGARIGSYLDEAGWPSGEQNVSTGQITVQAFQGQCATILQEIKRVEETEHGLFLMSKDGLATFQSSTHRAGGTPASTFSNTGQVPYTDIAIGYDDLNIWNDVTVQPNGLGAQAVDDTGSVDSYGRRKLHVFDTLHVATTAAQDLGNTLLGTYKDPQTRLESLTVTPRSSPAAAWPAVLNSEVSDLMRVRRTADVGSVVSEDVYVESVSHEMDVEKNWTVTYSLSPST